MKKVEAGDKTFRWVRTFKSETLQQNDIVLWRFSALAPCFYNSADFCKRPQFIYPLGIRFLRCSPQPAVTNLQTPHPDAVPHRPVHMQRFHVDALSYGKCPTRSVQAFQRSLSNKISIANQSFYLLW